MVGASGNTAEYDEYFAELGAAMGVRDDVFAAAPGCPVMTRHKDDLTTFWLPNGAHSFNQNVICFDRFQICKNNF